MPSEIPTTFPSSPVSAPDEDPQVRQFYNLWDAWFDHPTASTAASLLHFLQDPNTKLYFEQIAAKKPAPFPRVPFEEAYETALSSLNGWIEDGCNPNLTRAPSEFINDIAEWIE